VSGHLHAGPVDSEAGEAEADCCTVISEHRATLRLLASVWVGLLLLLLLRGGKGLPSLLGFPTCGAAYWALTALAVGGLALCAAPSRLCARSRAISSEIRRSRPLQCARRPKPRWPLARSIGREIASRATRAAPRSAEITRSAAELRHELLEGRRAVVSAP